MRLALGSGVAGLCAGGSDGDPPSRAGERAAAAGAVGTRRAARSGGRGLRPGARQHSGGSCPWVGLSRGCELGVPSALPGFVPKAGAGDAV